MSTPSVYVHTDAPKTTEKMITSVLFFGRLLISWWLANNSLVRCHQYLVVGRCWHDQWLEKAWFWKSPIKKKPSGLPLKLQHWHVKLAFLAFFSLINTKTKYFKKKKKRVFALCHHYWVSRWTIVCCCCSTCSPAQGGTAHCYGCVLCAPWLVDVQVRCCCCCCCCCCSDTHSLTQGCLSTLVKLILGWIYNRQDVCLKCHHGCESGASMALTYPTTCYDCLVHMEENISQYHNECIVSTYLQLSS